MDALKSQTYSSDALSGGTLLLITSKKYLYFAHYPEKAPDSRNNFENSLHFQDIILNPLRRDMPAIQRWLGPDLEGAGSFAVILTPALALATVSPERYPAQAKKIKDFVKMSLPRATVVSKSYPVLPKRTHEETTADKVIVQWKPKDVRDGKSGSSATVYYGNRAVHSAFWPAGAKMRCCGLLGRGSDRKVE